jgi:hypothetical protein
MEHALANAAFASLLIMIPSGSLDLIMRMMAAVGSDISSGTGAIIGSSSAGARSRFWPTFSAIRFIAAAATWSMGSSSDATSSASIAAPAVSDASTAAMCASAFAPSDFSHLPRCVKPLLPPNRQNRAQTIA